VHHALALVVVDLAAGTAQGVLVVFVHVEVGFLFQEVIPFLLAGLGCLHKVKLRVLVFGETILLLILDG
jgi:hypothetical protein